MSQITATARALSRAFSRATRAAQVGQAIYARAWFREPRVFTNDAAQRLTYKPFEGANLAHHSGIQSDFEQSSACHFIQAYIGFTLSWSRI